LQSNEDWLKNILPVQNLSGLSTGRKSCPLLAWYAGHGTFVDLEAALHNELPAGARLRAVMECAPAEGVLRRDEVDSNQNRTFLPRYTREIWLASAPPAEEK
jgi:hypothetical protein